MHQMTGIESDFLEFISGEDRDSQEIKSHYLEAKNRFDFTTPQYKKFILSEITHHCEYDAQTGEGLIDLYKFSERWWLYRYLAYSHRKEMKETYARMAANIIKNSARPIVIDYGCGLGYISFEIGRRKRYSEIFLADLDNLILKFADFHFAKHGIEAKLIRINAENLYPLLPQHDVCICWEVFEHLKEPLKAFKNIISSMKPRGLLCGVFRDHSPDPTHVSPNLGLLRKQIAEYFIPISQYLYRRKNEIR